MSLADMNFNLDTDVIEEPLLREGNYNGSIIGVVYNGEKHNIDFQICLNNNEGVTKLDGETPADGKHFSYKSWLPKPGDEEIPASNGAGTKANTKLAMLKELLINLGVEDRTSAGIAAAIQNSEWVGMDVTFKITLKHDDYRGKLANDIGFGSLKRQ